MIVISCFIASNNQYGSVSIQSEWHGELWGHDNTLNDAHVTQPHTKHAFSSWKKTYHGGQAADCLTGNVATFYARPPPAFLSCTPSPSLSDFLKWIRFLWPLFAIRFWHKWVKIKIPTFLHTAWDTSFNDHTDYGTLGNSIFAICYGGISSTTVHGFDRRESWLQRVSAKASRKPRIFMWQNRTKTANGNESFCLST